MLNCKQAVSIDTERQVTTRNWNTLESLHVEKGFLQLQATRERSLRVASQACHKADKLAKFCGQAEVAVAETCLLKRATTQRATFVWQGVSFFKLFIMIYLPMWHTDVAASQTMEKAKAKAFSAAGIAAAAVAGLQQR